jgi:prefoldin subunit 5
MCKKQESKSSTVLSKSDMSKLERAIQKLKEKNSELQSTIDNLEEMKTKQAKEIQILNAALDEELQESDPEQLIYQAAAMRVECDNMENELHEKDEQIQYLQHNLQEVTEDRDRIQSDFSQVANELEHKTHRVSIIIVTRNNKHLQSI